MLIMGRELSETGVRCEKSYWKSSQPVKIWQNNIVVVTKIVFVGHPNKKYSTYPNFSDIFMGLLRAPHVPTGPMAPGIQRQSIQVRLSVVAPHPVWCRGRKELSDRQADQTWWHWWNQNCWFGIQEIISMWNHIQDNAQFILVLDQLIIWVDPKQV
jgi:hypothetical protein